MVMKYEKRTSPMMPRLHFFPIKNAELRANGIRTEWAASN